MGAKTGLPLAASDLSVALKKRLLRSALRRAKQAGRALAGLAARDFLPVRGDDFLCRREWFECPLEDSERVRD